MKEKINAIQDQLVDAIAQRSPLKITGGDSKSFLGRETIGSVVNMSTYSGIISYEPTELYITARAGTLLSEINQVLAEHRQMLAFEPPQINDKTTIGGVIATGLSGPRRPYSGSVRDHVLGIRCINGLGKDMTFGGQVMKNVAGYDLSRLMTGAFGTLGIILEISLSVMPQPAFEMTCRRQLSASVALAKMLELSRQAMPISASCYDGNELFIRLSGNKKVVKETSTIIAFDDYEQGPAFWNHLRDYKMPFFNSDTNIWRLSVPVTANLHCGQDPFIIEWGGSLYWLNSKRPAREMFNIAHKMGGSAMLLHGNVEGQDVFHPLTDAMLSLHKRLKNAFDPHGILNPGKLYATL